MESVKPNMSTTKTQNLGELFPKPKVSNKPCLILNKDDNTTLNVLHYALVNTTIQESDIEMQVCATFPSRRAIFVVEQVGKSAGIIRYRNIEFYEFTPEQGWKFKKLYRTSLL